MVVLSEGWIAKGGSDGREVGGLESWLVGGSTSWKVGRLGEG
jgi:hypothetical protein